METQSQDGCMETVAKATTKTTNKLLDREKVMPHIIKHKEDPPGLRVGGKSIGRKDSKGLYMTFFYTFCIFFIRDEGTKEISRGCFFWTIVSVQACERGLYEWSLVCCYGKDFPFHKEKTEEKKKKKHTFSPVSPEPFFPLTPINFVYRTLGRWVESQQWRLDEITEILKSDQKGKYLGGWDVIVNTGRRMQGILQKEI